MEDYKKIEKEADSSSDYLKASFLYGDALGIAKRMNASSAVIKRLKRKLVDSNKQSLAAGDKYYKEFTFKYEFTDAQMESIRKVIDGIIKVNSIDEILKLIGVHPAFKDGYNYKKIVEASKKNMPISILLASNSKISQEGHIVKGSSNGEESWAMDMYDIHINSLLNIYLIRLLRMLIASDRLTSTKLINYFRGSNLFTENMNLIEVGIERFFSGDYVSSIHILIPQFENVFLKLSDGLGIDIIALERTKDTYTRTRTLSTEILYTDEFIVSWGEDLCRLIGFVLYEPLGYKLRHKLAHGEIQHEECNFDRNVLILYLYLVILSTVKINPN